MQTQKNNVQLIIKAQKLDSTSQFCQYALYLLVTLDDIGGQDGKMERSDAPSEKGRIPRELADLRTYMKLVENKHITVVAACEKLGITKSTYYRRIKQLNEIINEEIEDEENETI